MKKSLAMLLAAALLLSCASFALANEETPVLTIAVEALTNVEDYSTNTFTKYLEEKLGVKLEFQIWSEPTTKLSLLVGGNTKLPDIICFPLDNTTIFKYGSTGVFQPLNEYYQNAELAVNFQALPQEKQALMLSSIKQADGNMYSMPLLGEFFPNNSRYNLLINKTWLDELNLEIPATTEDLRKVLKAFAENDLNHNGEKDEIPMLSCTNGFGTNVAGVLLNSFVKCDPSKGYCAVENGKISAAFMTDAFRDGLRYIRTLVDEGLLDAASFTQTKDQFKAITNQEVARVGILQIGDHDQAFTKPADAPAGYISFYDHPLASQYVYMQIPEGPTGEHNKIYAPTTPNQLFFITKDCQNPELAFRLGDLGYDSYASLISRHGTEGKNWTRDPEILKNYKAATINGETLAVEWVLLEDPWGRAQNEHWYQRYPGWFAIDFNLKRGQKLDAKPSKIEIVYDMFQSTVPTEYIATQVYTAEELDELAFMSVESYVSECITAFATGNMDIEKDWDRYINELKSMDVERFIQIMQSGYDRAHQ